MSIEDWCDERGLDYPKEEKWEDQIIAIIKKMRFRCQALQRSNDRLKREVLGYRIRDMDALREELKRRDIKPDLKYTKDLPSPDADGLWYWCRTPGNKDQEEPPFHDVFQLFACYDIKTKEFLHWSWMDAAGNLEEIDVEKYHWAGPIIPPEDPEE